MRSFARLMSLWFALATAASPAIAHAQIWGNVLPNASAGGGGSYTGPGDVVLGATWFYGVRAYNNSYAASLGAAFDWNCSNAGAHSGTVHVTSAGALNATELATMASQCGAQLVFVSKLYDQTGNGNHATQATAGSQPQFVATGCAATQGYCFANGNARFWTGTSGSAAQPWTLSTVVLRNAAGASNVWIAAKGGAWAVGFAATNQAGLYAGVGVVTAPATDAALRAIAYQGNGASSAINVDGTTTGSLNAGTAAAASTYGILADDIDTSNLVGQFNEVGLWPSGFTSSLCHNQFAYYGTATPC